MKTRFLEDFPAGYTVTLGPRLVTREEIVGFAAEFDPQPMHMDEEAGRRSLLGGLAGSGWHSCCLMMRMLADGVLADTHSMGAPGVDEIRWLSPLRPGVSISVIMTVLDNRRSQSRPDRGFLKSHFEVVDQDGIRIMTMDCSLMLAARPEAAE
jgi:acyl dehydratase